MYMELATYISWLPKSPVLLCSFVCCPAHLRGIVRHGKCYNFHASLLMAGCQLLHCNNCKSAPACPQRFGQLRCTTWQPMQGFTGRSYKVHMKPVAKAISHICSSFGET